MADTLSPTDRFSFPIQDEFSPETMNIKMKEQKKLLEQDIRALVLVNVMCNILHSHNKYKTQTKWKKVRKFYRATSFLRFFLSTFILLSNFFEKPFYCVLEDLTNNCTTSKEGKVRYFTSGLPLFSPKIINLLVLMAMILLLIFKGMKVMSSRNSNDLRQSMNRVMLGAITLIHFLYCYVVGSRMSSLDIDSLLRILFFIFYK